MFSKLFLKFYMRISIIVLASFLTLGSALLIFVWRYSTDLKQKQLFDGANRVSSITASYDGFSLSYQRAYRNTLKFVSDITSADIYVFDLNGNIIEQMTIMPRQNKSVTISKNIIDKITQAHSSIYKETGNLDSFLDRTSYSVGVPFLADDNVYGGFIVMTAPAQQLTSLLFDIMRMFLICLFASLIIAFIWLYFTMAKLLEPLKAMSSAAKNFALGNFEERIPVEGDDEIGNLALSFNNMAASLAALEEMRSGFVSDVSHELKTPMTTISGFIDGILDGTVPKQKYNYYLNIVSNEIKRLSRLVNSLLDIARINSGNVQYEFVSFDINSMLAKVSNTMELAAKEKNVKIVLTLPPQKVSAFADEDAIYRVVYNLAENAVKFTDEGGIIEFAAAVDDKKIYIGVKNSGQGISKEDLPYIFDRFYKSDKSRGLDTKGAGLGLYMSKQIINAHKEEIWAKSEQGKYAEFVFTLKPYQN